MYNYKECGLDDVTLVNGYRIDNDEEFGTLVFIEDRDQLHRAIALRLIGKPDALVGAEMKFLRTHLDLTQRQLAGMLATNEQSIAKFEKARGKPIGNRPLERLFRIIAMSLIDEARISHGIQQLIRPQEGPDGGGLQLRHADHDWREDKAA